MLGLGLRIVRESYVITNKNLEAFTRSTRTAQRSRKPERFYGFTALFF